MGVEFLSDTMQPPPRARRARGSAPGRDIVLALGSHFPQKERYRKASKVSSSSLFSLEVGHFFIIFSVFAGGTKNRLWFA